MYIKVTKNSAGQSYYHLVESYWEKGRSRQRTLLALGKVSDGRLDELVSAISRHKDVMGILDVAKSIDIESTYLYGPLVILEKMCSKFGIQSILDRVTQAHPKLGFDFWEVVFTQMVCRFIRPGSKLKVFEYWQNKLYPKMITANIKLHQIYRSLDILCSHKEEIEKSLFWHDRNLFEMEVDVVLYDLTTLRFESVREDLGELRRFGFSKEKRTDCTQVVLGLLLDTDGIPLGFEVYPGNTFEGKTVRDIVRKVRSKFKVRRFIFVADRGIFSKPNLEEIRQECQDGREGEFIVGMRLKILKESHKGFYDIKRFTWISEEWAVYESAYNQDRCIVTWSKTRAKRDRQVRDDILDKIRKKLANKNVNIKTFVTNKNYQKYLTGLDDGKRPTLNEQAIAKEAAKDGYFGVITNIKDMSASEIVCNYKNLWMIEDAFGEMKGTLRSRPMFHWTDRRIVGHLTLCFLSLFCEAQLTKLLRESGMELNSSAIDHGVIDSRPLSVVEAMRELCEVRAIPVKLKGKVVWVRTDIAGNAAKLFKVCNLQIPPRVLNMKELQIPAGTKS